MLALRRGWLASDNVKENNVANACKLEDNGGYKCVAKRGMLDRNIQNGVLMVLESQHKNSTNMTYLIRNTTGEDIAVMADELYNEYWQEYRDIGASCDFGGVAELKPLDDGLHVPHGLLIVILSCVGILGWKRFKRTKEKFVVSEADSLLRQKHPKIQTLSMTGGIA